MITLASTSLARRTLLQNAGVALRWQAPGIDEESVKASLLAESLSPRDVADALAEMKAVRVSERCSGLVLGADQTLEIDGDCLSKPETLAALKAQLTRLRGRTHRLHVAVVAAEDGQPIWRRLTKADLTLRPFSDAFLEAYVTQCGEAVLSAVGGYHLESLGAQLFSEVRGDYFTILGLPLIETLDFLRVRGELDI